MQTFRHHAASADCAQTGELAGMSAVLRGPLSAAAFGSLGPQVMNVTRGAPVVVIRLDGSAHVMEQMPEAKEGQDYYAPEGCIIVRRDQSALWSAYADNLAQYGIKRVVFLDSQLNQALRWVQRRSLLRALPAL